MRFDLVGFFRRQRNSIDKRLLRLPLPPAIRTALIHRQLWQKVRPQPFGKQEARRELVEQIVPLCAIARFVETGTYVGNTTAFLAQFGLPVLTAEINPLHASIAAKRLLKLTNVQLRCCHSVQVLQELAYELGARAAPTFFYLDAHWNETHRGVNSFVQELPLRAEIELVLNQFSHAVVMIDDFQVPGDPGYAFDDYGPGRTLNLEYLLAAKTPPLAIYFPSVPSQEESGWKKGCVVVTANSALAMVLDKLHLLQRWHANAHTA